jgi:hypothetical protein
MGIKNAEYRRQNIEGGSILIYTVVIIFIFSLVMLGILSYATIQLKTLKPEQIITNGT